MNGTAKQRVLKHLPVRGDRRGNKLKVCQENLSPFRKGGPLTIEQLHFLYTWRISPDIIFKSRCRFCWLSVMNEDFTAIQGYVNHLNRETVSIF